MRKILFTLLLSMQTIASLAYDAYVDGVYYNLVTKLKIAEVTNETGGTFDASYSGNVIIPEEIIVDGVSYKVTSIGESTFQNCHYLKSVDLPNSVTSIGSGAFSQCDGLISVNLGDSITTIERAAFINCMSLKSIDLPNTLKSIGNNAFNGCSGLISITIPEGVTSIGDQFFIGCRSLTSVTLPNTVTYIGSYSFDGCTNLPIIEIPSSVVSIGSDAFRSCSSLKTVIIGSSLETIRSNAFDGCINLTSIVLPNSIKRIGSYAFNGCSKLKNITLGTGLEMIEPCAFNKCKDLEEVVCYAENVPNTSTDVFKDCYIEYASLYVPDMSMDAYKSANQWSDFGLIMSISEKPYYISYYVDGGLLNKQQYKQGQSIIPEPSPNKEGHTFSGWSEIPELMPDHDVDVSGSFTVNDYKVTFISEGSIIKEEILAFGTTISIPESPEKIGHTFTGWNPTVDATVPAHDVTYTAQFSVNQYTITFDTDGGTEIAPITQDYGTSITKPKDPTKEGYTFTGWNAEIPEIMPAENLTIKATWAINAYKLTYILDGNIYKEYTLDYKSTITPEVEPTKEGYTFSGWSEIPSTMPAHDVEINGSFEVNTYKVSYFVENDLVHVDEVEFGKAFDLWTYVPEGNDITFNGWIGELYDTMPAHDITYRADITSGIAYIYNNAENISGIFTLGGRKVEKMDKGVYIVKMKNGNTRKVVNK